MKVQHRLRIILFICRASCPIVCVLTLMPCLKSLIRGKQHCVLVPYFSQNSNLCLNQPFVCTLVTARPTGALLSIVSLCCLRRERFVTWAGWSILLILTKPISQPVYFPWLWSIPSLFSGYYEYYLVPLLVRQQAKLYIPWVDYTIGNTQMIYHTSHTRHLLLDVSSNSKQSTY